MSYLQGRVDESLGLVSNLLDISAKRHEALAHNLANVNTPHFTRKDVPFVKELREAISNGRGSEPLSISIVEDKSSPYKTDGNNVDVELEMAELTKNRVLFNIAAQFMNGRINHYRSAISGRSS